MKKGEKKKRRKAVIAIVVGIMLASCILFFDVLFNYFTTNHLKRPAITKKLGIQAIRLSIEEERLLLAEITQLVEQGNFDTARERVFTLLKRSPSSKGHYLAGLIYLRQGNIKGAYDELKEAVRLDPQDMLAQEKLGEIYVMVGDFTAAQKQAHMLLGAREYLGNGLLIEAEIAMRQGNHARALEKATQAFVNQVPPPKQKVFLASLYARIGDIKKSQSIIATLSPGELDAEGMISMARYYALMGNDNRANELYRIALRRFTRNAEVMYAYGQHLCARGQFEAAIPHLADAHRTLPGVAVITYQLGQAYIGAGKYEQVLPLIQELFSRDANNVLAWRLKSRYSLARGDRREAIHGLETLIRLIPEAGALCSKLAELYFQEGEMSLAEKNARRAIELGEKTAVPYQVLGDIYVRQHRWQEARSFYDEELKIQPGNLSALLMAGDCELNLGRYTRAEELYRRPYLFLPLRTLSMPVSSV